MSKDEALKMAIEALEQAEKQLEKYWNEDINRGYDIEDMNESPIILCEDTINACKEALEQPAQEPVAWMSKMGSFTAIAETKKQLPKGTEPIPLYTHPHQWQGLTDDEIDKIVVNSETLLAKDIARAIEQALKEKNT
jgi:hypothetical protein